MSELHLGVTGRKPNQQSETTSQLQPLLVPVVEARRLLGGIGNNNFWKLVKVGELELVGTLSMWSLRRVRLWGQTESRSARAVVLR
jgi:hypothetical protein